MDMMIFSANKKCPTCMKVEDVDPNLTKRPAKEKTVDLDEQKMMQIWLASLHIKLEAGQVDEVKQEIAVALGRIEEDQDDNIRGTGEEPRALVGGADDTRPESDTR
jgi:hypothetical protein